MCQDEFYHCSICEKSFNAKKEAIVSRDTLISA